MPNEINPAEFLANLFHSGQDALRNMAGTPSDSIAESDPTTNFVSASKAITDLQLNYLRQVSSWWSGVLGVGVPQASAPLAEEKRFSGEAWKSDPRYGIISQSYLTYANFLQNSIEAAAVDEKTKDQLRFGVRQFVDLISPANFLGSNPEAIKLAVETGGQSLVEGMGLLFEDLAKGRISMTDETAFEVGKNIATTEGAVVFRNELIELIQYAPRTEKVFKRPLVIVPPCINKFYILDLQPENSLVRYALEHGHSVFMVSWRNITGEYGQLTWDEYLTDGVIKAIDVALGITGADEANTLGFCIGGTLLTSAVAVMKANAEEKVSSMTLLTTMLDFSETGELGVLVSEQSASRRESTIGRGGVMPGKELAFTFSSLRANDLIWPYVVNSYLKGKRPVAFDLLYWNSDSTNLPGPMFCWYVRNTYLENNLRIPGKTVQCDIPIDLSTVDVPAYIFACREDHIVPWRTAYLSTGLLTGKRVFVLGASGHIAGVINPPAKNKRNFWHSTEVGADADSWLDSATQVPGSWWPNWSAWLEPLAGETVAARRKLGNKAYRPLEAAPGSYVKARDD